MNVKSRIEDRLSEALSPDYLSVVDESHMRIRIVSSAFAGMSRVARHRTVNDLVKAEFEAGLHALAIEAVAPGEPTRWPSGRA